MIKNKLFNFLNIKENEWYYRYRYFKLKKKFKIFDKLKLNKNSIIIDLGSNVGDVTKYLSESFDSYVYSYEPNFHAYEIQLNRLSHKNKIFFFNECVDKENGEKKIFFHKNAKYGGDVEWSQATSLDENKSNISRINYKIVKATSINSILKKFKKIDLIKIDIEGYEYEILPILIQNKYKIKKVICEIHGRPSNKNKYKNYAEKYNNLIEQLKKNNLLNNWFIEWH